jgi:DNA-binding NarL/FixJ family response regulator
VATLPAFTEVGHHGCPQLTGTLFICNSLKATIQIDALTPEYTQVLEDYPLTERELEILELIVGGCSNAEIAEQAYITVGTVKTHVRNILNKLGVDDRTKAAVRALRSGLVT